MENQEIRQALNKVEITGVVLEHRLNAGKGDNGKYINGSLVIKAGEFTEITTKVFVAETNKQGKVKKAYENLEKILNGEVKTMAEVSEDEAVKVRLWGNEDFTPQFKEEIFKPENAAEVVTKVGIDLGFGNVTIDNKITPDDYKATFDVEMYVEEVQEEIDKNDEETGRVVVKGWCPVYGGSVIPLEIKAGVIKDDDGEEIDFAEEIRSNVDAGNTVNIWGDIDFRAIIEKKKKGGSLGKAKVEEKRTYVHDLIAAGAEFIEGDDEYDVEDIKRARIERENKIDEEKNKVNEESSKKNKKSGLASRRSTLKNKVSKANIKPNKVDDDELPF